MEGLKMIPYVVLILAITGIILGASVIIMGKFGDSASITKCASNPLGGTTPMTYNSALDKCGYFNASGMSTVGKLNFTDEYYAVYETNEGLADVSEQQPTVAIIAIMVIIISIIAGVFTYMQFFR